MATNALEIIEWSTGDVVHTVNVAGKSDREIETVTRGMLRNMDRDRFGVREQRDDESEH